jgi:outer membrane immunogenic protein
MKLRNALFSSVAVVGLLVGAASLSVARAAEVEAGSWSGFYIGVGGGGATSVGDVNATGYSDSDFSSGASDSGSNFNIYASGSTDFSGDADNQINIGNGYVDGLATGAGPIGQFFDAGKAGFLGRAEIGADFESDGVLFGLNGSFGLMNLKQKAAVNDEFDIGIMELSGDDYSGSASGSGSGSLATELKYGNSFTVGARAGFLATPSTLLFAGGGFARQKVKLSADYSAGFSGSFDFSGSGSIDDESGVYSGGFEVSSTESKWANGYYVGGGVEQMFGSNTSLRLEYRFTDLGSINTSTDTNYSGGDIDIDDADTGVAAEADLRTHAVTATLNFRF